MYEFKLNFGEAIDMMKRGHFVCREGWNGNGIFIGIAMPTPGGFITQPFIYIDTTQLKTTNPAAVKGRVPWLASQTDMLAEDWTNHIPPFEELK